MGGVEKHRNLHERIERLKAKFGSRTDEEIEKWEKELAKISQPWKPAGGRKASSGKSPSHKEQNLISFLPTQLTRTSPFFPMFKNETKRHFSEPLIQENPWGKITITGWKLNIYDETILLSLLWLFKKHGSDTFKTTRHELCKIMGVPPSPSSYNAIWKSLHRLTATAIEFELWEGKGKDRKRVRKRVNTILTKADEEEKTAKILIAINRFLIVTYAEGLVTNINLNFRLSLKGDTSKALYRFFQGQRSFYREGKYECQLIKLCQAVNLKTDGVKNFNLRKGVRRGLRELRARKYLNRWRLSKRDYVTVWRAKYR